MTKLLADWRNPALVLAIAGTLIFGVLWHFAHEKSAGPAIVVGNKTFTEGDITRELKTRHGKEVVTKMVNDALIETYASEKGVEASDAEIDQLLHAYQNSLEIRGQDLDALLDQQGITIDTLRKDMRIQALQVKLVVSPGEIRAKLPEIAKKREPPFTMPDRYRLRFFTFADAATAQQAAATLQNAGTSEDTLNEVASTAISGLESKRIQLYAPGGLTAKDEMLSALLKGMKPGQCSKPVAVPGQKSMQLVIQLVALDPAITPTYENSAISIGQFLMQSEPQKFAERQRDLETAILNNVDFEFLSPDYEGVSKQFRQRKLANPVLPGMTGKPATPASATPTKTGGK